MGLVGPTRLIVQHLGMDTQLECRFDMTLAVSGRLVLENPERSYNRVPDRSFVHHDKMDRV